MVFGKTNLLFLNGQDWIVKDTKAETKQIFKNKPALKYRKQKSYTTSVKMLPNYNVLTVKRDNMTSLLGCEDIPEDANLFYEDVMQQQKTIKQAMEKT